MKTKAMLVFVVVAAIAATAGAATKFSGTSLCKQAPPSSVPVGDSPDHSLSLGKADCTWSKLELAGLAGKTGVSVVSADSRGDLTTELGYHTASMVDGDQFSVRFEGKMTTQAGKPVVDAGSWKFVHGTGKLKGLQGQGTFRGTPNADGSMTYQIEGEYTLP